MRRSVIDALQWLGWNTLPLEKLPVSLAARFAQGLFKFKSVRICGGCGLGVIDPMPSPRALDRYYASFFDLGTSLPADPPLNPRGVSQANYLVQTLDFSQIAQMLEFGAGTASLTRKLKQYHPGLRATIVEMSLPMLEPLQRNPLIEAADTDYAGPPASFDLVVSSHALEHIDDATAVLRKWVSWVRPGGWLMVEVPHANSDHYSVAHEFVPHSYFFTKSALQKLVEACGMKTIAIGAGGQSWGEARSGRPYPTDPAEWSATGDAGANLRGLWRKAASGPSAASNGN